MSLTDGLLVELLVKDRIAELHREAHAERLANALLQAQPRGRSLRSRLADGLHALAERIAGSPQLSPLEA